jgi:hypothetical protein
MNMMKKNLKLLSLLLGMSYNGSATGVNFPATTTNVPVRITKALVEQDTFSIRIDSANVTALDAYLTAFNAVTILLLGNSTPKATKIDEMNNAIISYNQHITALAMPGIGDLSTFATAHNSYPSTTAVEPVNTISTAVVGTVKKEVDIIKGLFNGAQNSSVFKDFLSGLTFCFYNTTPKEARDVVGRYSVAKLIPAASGGTSEVKVQTSYAKCIGTGVTCFLILGSIFLGARYYKSNNTTEAEDPQIDEEEKITTTKKSVKIINSHN